MSIRNYLPNLRPTSSPIVLATAECAQDTPLLAQIVTTARGAADALFLPSVVARNSEADNLQDVAVWLGQGDFSIPANVVEALGLEKNSQVYDIPLEDDYLPPGIEVPPSKVDIASEWSREMAKLHNKYSFRVRLSEGVWLFVLVFSLSESEWGALVGAAVWSDE